MNAREAAQTYIERGRAVVPLPPGQKAPRTPRWQHGGFTADDIDPAGNVGILMGEPSGGLVDVDFDVYEPSLFRECFPLTGSSFGRPSKPQGHLLFYCESPGKTRKWRTTDGQTIVELRSTGGQTMAPGSTHPDGEAITWCSDGGPASVTWQELELACEDYANAVRAARGEPVTPDPVPSVAPAAGGDREQRHAETALQSELATVRGAGEGSRNDTLNRAALKLGHFIGGGHLQRGEVEDVLLDAALETGLPQAEAQATIRSGIDAGAREPWQAPAQAPPADSTGEQPCPLPPYVDVADFLAEPLQMADPIVHGLLRRGETATLVSSSKARKSWTAQELCEAVASGGRWFGLKCRRGRALLIDCELHRATLQHRIRAILRAKDVDPEAVRDRLKVAAWRGQSVTLEGLTVYLAAIRPGEFDLIVADPIYKLYPKGFEENSNAEMAELFGNFQILAERVQAALLLVCHSPKGDTSARTTIDLVSGAGSAGRAVDVAVALRAHESGEPGAPVIVRETITRSFPDLPPECFRWEHPRWIAAPDLDPRNLKRPGRRSGKAKPTEPPKPVGDATADFAAQFIGAEPKTRAAIVDAAVQTGLTENRAKKLLAAAEGRRLAHRWTLGPSKPVQFATKTQPALDDGEGAK